MAKETTRRKLLRFKKMERGSYLVFILTPASSPQMRKFGNRADARRFFRAERKMLLTRGIINEKGWAAR